MRFQIVGEVSCWSISMTHSRCHFVESESLLGEGGCSVHSSWAMLLDLADLRIFSLSVAALDTAHNSDNDADAAKNWPHDDQDDDGDAEAGRFAGSLYGAHSEAALRADRRVVAVRVTAAGICAWACCLGCGASLNGKSGRCCSAAVR